MTIIIVFILLLLTAFFVFRRKWISALILSVCSIILVELIGSGIVPYLLLKPLETKQQQTSITDWKATNAIVLLGGGLVKSYDSQNIFPTLLAYPRLFEAAGLYFSCQKTQRICRIIITGGDPKKMGQTEAELYRKALLQLPINPADILIESASQNTYQNARYTSLMLKKQQFERIILVTSGFHCPRSVLFFNHFGVNASCWPADKMSVIFSALPHALNFAATDFALHEYIGFLQFYLYHL